MACCDWRAHRRGPTTTCGSRRSVGLPCTTASRRCLAWTDKRSETRPVRALVQDSRLPVADLGVPRQHVGGEIGLRPRLEVEMAEAVAAAHERGAIAHVRELSHPGGHISDREAHAPIPG